MGLMQEAIGVTHNVVPLMFTLANVAKAQDGTAVPVNANGNYYTMPWQGHVIGMGVYLNDAVTANTITFKPTVNGTEDTDLTVQLDTTNTQHHEANIAAVDIPFAAGDRIGCVYDSHASLAPDGSADVNVVIFVVLERVRY